MAVVAKHPMDGFVGMAVALAGIGAGLALANIFTVFTALPVEKRAGSPCPECRIAAGLTQTAAAHYGRPAAADVRP